MIQFLLAALLLLGPFSPPAEDVPVEPTAAPEVQEAEEAAVPEEGAEGAGPETAEPAQGEREQLQEPAIKPRFELYIPSIEHLMRRSRASHAGVLLSHTSGLFSAKAAGGRGFTEEDWSTLADMVRHWPDTSLAVATFAPTAEGKRRWFVRLDWPLADLHARASEILEMKAAEEMLEGVTLTGDESGYQLTLGDVTLAVMLPDDAASCLIVSDAEVPRPEALYGQDAKGDQPPKDTSTLVYSRFNIAGTEKDSGALFGTQIPWVDNIRYQASVRTGGEWSERFGVAWNAMVGTAAKAVIKNAKRGFHVPREAFGAALVSSPMLQSMLDLMAGLEPGTLMSEVGGLTGDRVGPEMCFVLLPGTGILPFPDIVIQTRVRYESAVQDDIRKAVAKKNEERAKDELPEIWHEMKVDDRAVFYYDARDKADRGMQPAVYRTVLFFDERTDPTGRARTYLNIGFTSTDVEALVRRWTRPLAEGDRVALASSKQVDAHGWLNWSRLYDSVCVWLNVAIAGIDPMAVLPPTDAVKDQLSDAMVTVNAKYTGLLIRHRGPVPAGLLYLPLTMASTLAPDESGSTDLSRERIACDRLKLLHKNALLFKKDVGRWPARVAELDGYIDFAGSPWVLKLRRSTRSAWREGFKDLLSPGDEETEQEGEETDIDDSIFVITWDGTHWTLGLKPGTLDHLEALYIDQDGKIHRVAKSESAQRTGVENAADASLM
ncbi:MAG: hypothetical protein JSU68_08935 [Phycisphaerales bacterium]|nr:MAG: hypothetical protein JSU68_08935 [Phycisphaerales bacterium]